MCRLKLYKIKHLFKEGIKNKDKHYGYQEEASQDLTVKSIHTAF